MNSVDNPLQSILSDAQQQQVPPVTRLYTRHRRRTTLLVSSATIVAASLLIAAWVVDPGPGQGGNEAPPVAIESDSTDVPLRETLPEIPPASLLSNNQINRLTLPRYSVDDATSSWLAPEIYQPCGDDPLTLNGDQPQVVRLFRELDTNGDMVAAGGFVALGIVALADVSASTNALGQLNDAYRACPDGDDVRYEVTDFEGRNLALTVAGTQPNGIERRRLHIRCHASGPYIVCAMVGNGEVQNLAPEDADKIGVAQAQLLDSLTQVGSE